MSTAATTSVTLAGLLFTLAHMAVEESPFSHIEKPKKRAFLAAYARCGSLRAAQEISGVNRWSHSATWIKSDREYIEAFEQAKQMHVERLEEEADRRAMEGVSKPVFYKGAVVGYTVEHSDTLLMFRLNALAPEKYRYRQHVTADVTHHEADSQLDADIERLLAQMKEQEGAQPGPLVEGPSPLAPDGSA